MRCPKCSYITFDFYDSCPKCGGDFTLLKKELNIVEYSINDDNNYLTPIQEETVIFNKNAKEEILDNEIEKTVEEKQSNEQDVDEVDGISLEDLLETTKLEEE